MVIAVIGGGPAGILAAIAASNGNNEISNIKNFPNVYLFEKNEKLGKKLFISGKGRCNLTNASDKDEFFKNIVKNPKFLHSAFSEFSNIDMMKLIENNGCKLKVERGKRVFPISDKSNDVLKALNNAIKKSNVKVQLNTEVKKINLQNGTNKFEIIFKDGKKILSDKVIIATGGLSYPSTGSTGDGYKFAESFGINVSDLTPSLVPFNIKEIEDCKMMQGLSLKNVGIKIFDENNYKKILYKDFGEMIFTHFGVSGPIILSASCYVDVDKEKVLSIDLKPALDEEKLNIRLIREFNQNKNKQIKSVFETLLPQSMIDVFIQRLNKITKFNSNIKMSDVNKEQRKQIVKLLKEFRFTIVSKRDYNEAIVTRGGVDIKEINPKTMESKKIKNLYFAGEIIDIDAMTGGFNIQIAASTGYIAGKNSRL